MLKVEYASEDANEVREVAEDTEPTSDAVEEPVDAGFMLSIVLARRVRKDVAFAELGPSRETIGL